MRRQITKLILCLILVVPEVTFADDNQQAKGTLLNLSVSEFTEVKEDLLIANLRFETDGPNQKVVQNKINSIMKKAINEAKKFNKLAFSTEQYSVYKYYQPKKQGEKVEPVWHGSQSIVISGSASDDILKLTGMLQDMGLAVNSLGYSVSAEKREEVRDSLMEKAVEKLMKKAGRVAKALGKTDIKVVNINIDSDTYRPFPAVQFSMRASAMDKTEAVTPVASPGQSQVSMAVSATILIKD
ncbi:MAG: hypothetical protein Tsb006_4280 [Rickettsiaceae bacterium]